jgi:hypothetical protein
MGNDKLIGGRVVKLGILASLTQKSACNNSSDPQSRFCIPQKPS